MNRRGFLGMAAASIFVPRFGRFFREGSGSLWRMDMAATWPAWSPTRAQWAINSATAKMLDGLAREYFEAVYRGTQTPLLTRMRALGVA